MCRGEFALVPYASLRVCGAKPFVEGDPFLFSVEVKEKGGDVYDIFVERIRQISASSTDEHPCVELEIGFKDNMIASISAEGLADKTGGQPIKEVFASSSVILAIQKMLMAVTMIDDPTAVEVEVHYGGGIIRHTVELGWRTSYSVLSEGFGRLLDDFVSTSWGEAEASEQDASLQEEKDLALEHEAVNVTVLQAKRALDDDEDVRSVASDIGEEDFTEDLSRGVGFDDLKSDLMLARTVSGAEKLQHAAGLCAVLMHSEVRTEPNVEPIVVVLGDSPGHFSQELVYTYGLSVLGVDMDEKTRVVPAVEDRYKTIVAEVRTNEIDEKLPLWLASVGWGDRKIALVFCDMAGGAHTHVADTDLNWGCARILSARYECPAVAKLRTIPNMDYDGWVLATRGHEPRGAEVYLATGGYMVERVASMRMRGNGFHGQTATKVSLNPVSKAFKQLFLEVGLFSTDMTEDSFVECEGLSAYYSVIGLRARLEADRIAKSRLLRAAVQARSASELMFMIGTENPCTGAFGDLRGKFTDRDRIVTRTLDARTLGIGTHLTKIMQHRYGELARFCGSTTDSSENPDIGDFAKRPGFAALLHWNHSLYRDELGLELPHLKYKRVVPLAAMGILASRAWFRVLKWYVLMMSRLLRRPLHTWQLQALLWSLSNTGSQTEKEKYVHGLLADAYQHVLATRRSGDRTEGAAKSELGRMLKFAKALGVEKASLSPEVHLYLSRAREKVGITVGRAAAQTHTLRSRYGTTAGSVVTFGSHGISSRAGSFGAW